MHTYRSRSMPITPNIYAFEWESELWEFTCRLSELSSAPQVLTKVMKPFTSRMRRLGQITESAKHAFYRNTFINIMNALVFSKLYYCFKVWCNTFQTKLDEVQAVQNFACHIINGAKKYAT